MCRDESLIKLYPNIRCVLTYQTNIVIFLLKINDSHMFSWHKALQRFGLCKPEEMIEQLISLQRTKQYHFFLK